MSQSVLPPIYHEYLVVGREQPSEKNPNPKIYRMKLFCKNDVAAKSKFWFFVSFQKGVKRRNGEILRCSEIFDRTPTKVKNFGIFLRYDSRLLTHNLYMEYRDTTRAGAVTQLYNDMAGRYRARARAIQIISVDEILPADVKKAKTKQFITGSISFPLAHRLHKPNRASQKTFLRVRPTTYNF
eukprot:TRINITY_DN26889_c0_g1_i1.p1 TRINITY_DN26889_c0_g1~~TRINITY_DN26889_c0_g1_i1.p1  ORF type:complete len:183 (-),score=21.19 TRINITY_DN26889_c0_g1_i1:34-582(-)